MNIGERMEETFVHFGIKKQYILLAPLYRFRGHTDALLCYSQRFNNRLKSILANSLNLNLIFYTQKKQLNLFIVIPSPSPLKLLSFFVCFESEKNKSCLVCYRRTNVLLQKLIALRGQIKQDVSNMVIFSVCIC